MEKTLKNGKVVIQFTEEDLKKIIGYTLYDFAEIGLLNGKGLDMVNDKIEMDSQLMSEFGKGLNIYLEELQNYGEVL